jgi:hypothetical protein
VPHVSDSEITLSWFDRSTDEDGFIIERCAGQGCTQFSVLTTIPSTTSSPTRFETRYSDAGGGLAANGYYRYRIRAYRTVNGSDFFSSYLGPTEDIYTAKDIAPPCFYLRNSNSATQKGSVRRIARYGNRIYVAGEFNLAGPCSGPVQAIDEITLKPLDGVPGMGSGELFTQPLIYDVTEDPSDPGAYFVAGDQNGWVAGKNRTRVWRIKSNGKLDSSWGTGLTVSGRVNSIAVVGNVVYLAGTFTSVNGSTRNRLAALTRTTGALLNWNPGADSAVNLIRPSSDQSKVFVAGSFNQLGSSLSRQGIGALKLSTGVTGDGADPTGNTAVETWYPGAVTGGTILHFEPVGGSLFISGSFTQIGANARSRVAGIQESDGSVLTHPSITPNGNIHSSAYDSSRGLLFVVGAFTTINGTNRNYIAAIQVSDSALHSWYPTGGAGQAIPPNSSSINASSLELKGNRLFVGISPISTGSLGGVTTGGLAIVDLGSAVNPATSLSASRVVGTGYAGYGIKKSTGSSRLFCFSAGGSVSPAVMMSGHGVSNLAVYESHTGRILPSLSPTFNGVIHAAETFGSTLYVGGEFTQVNGTLTRNRLARIAYDGSVDSSWNPNVDGIVRTIAFDGEWVHIGGGFANVGGQSRRFVASISPSLGSSNAWNSEPDGTVRKLLLHQDRMYLGGDFSNLGSDAIKGVACYSMSSSSLCRQTGTLWNPNLSPAPSIYDLWVRNEGGNDFVYLVGSGFTAANGVTRNRAVKVATSFTDPNNPNPESWNPGISGYSLNGSAVACTDSECMIGGSFNNVGSATNQNIGFVNTGNGNSLSGRYSWMNAGADYFAYSIRYSRSAAANRGTLFITGDVGASATMYLQNLTSSNAYRVAGGVTAFHVDGSNTQPVPLIRGLIDPEEQP